jgi:hypothetical protein
MPNNSVSEDSDFISQDDIDQLLQLTDADDGHTLSDAEKDATETVDHAGDGDFLSQDDLDQLLQGVETEGENAGEDQDPGSEILEEITDEPAIISQNDIDQLLQIAETDADSAGKDEAVASEISGKDVNESESALISQNDIDQLLSSPDTEADSAREDEAVSPEILEEVVEDEALISQDDIDQLLKGDIEEPEFSEALSSDHNESASPETETPEESLISQADIDQLLSEDAFNPTDSDVSESAPEKIAQPEEADQAGGPKKYISQETIDTLLQQAESEDVLDSAVESHKVVLSEGNGSDVSEETFAADVSPEPDAEAGLITQDDIDKLLISDDDEDSTDNALESQSEDHPAAETAAEPERPDNALDAEVSASAPEASDEEEADAAVDIAWHGRKWVWAGALGTCVVLLTAVGLHFFPISFLKSQSQRQITYYPIVYPAEKEAQPAKKTRTQLITLKEFIIPAPEERKDFAYLAFDIDIDVIDPAAARRLRDHRPFFRKIIYDAISDEIKSDETFATDEMNIKMTVLSKLNAALPVEAGHSEKMISNVFLDDYKIQ